ncbi:MAG: DUF7662 domain-containing protein [Nitrosarchaeum sp.]
MTNYAQFLNYLENYSLDKINCTISQIEQIIGESLSASAYKYPAWWSNNPSYPLMKEILEIGWRSGNINLKNKTISFYKDSTIKQNTKKSTQSPLNLQSP